MKRTHRCLGIVVVVGLLSGCGKSKAEQCQDIAHLVYTEQNLVNEVEQAAKGSDAGAYAAARAKLDAETKELRDAKIDTGSLVLEAANAGRNRYLAKLPGALEALDKLHTKVMAKPAADPGDVASLKKAAASQVDDLSAEARLVTCPK